jgi:signal transduction histidine kinase
MARSTRPSPSPRNRPPPSRGEVESALAEMARRTATSRSVGEALKGQLGVLEGLLHPRTAWVATWDASRGLLGVEAVRGRNDARIAAVRPGEGMVGRAFSERRRQAEEGMEGLPVTGQQGPLGVLVLVGARARLGDELCEAVCAQLAAAWEVAQLRDDASRRGQELETAVAGLRQLERAREELLSHVSHELKNPLTAIKTYVGLLRRGRLGPVTPEQAAALDNADRNADGLARLINDLVLMSQLRSGEMTLNARPFGLRALIEETLQRLLGTAGLGKVQLAPMEGREAYVRGDRERTGEALMYLLETAIHLAAEGTAVRARVRAREGGVASVELSSTGTLLEDAALADLFDAFARARASRRLGRGAGMGLPIAARIIELHSGKVEVRRTGSGTDFEVMLPLYAGMVPSPGSPAPVTGTVLVVDDDADCRGAMLELLQAEGFTAEGAASAEAAVAALAERPAPALVLLDYALGDATGREVLRYVRASEPLSQVPVFVISGATDAARLTTGQGLERVDGFLEKPVQSARLLDTVRSLVLPRGAPSLSASSGPSGR